MQPLSEKRKKWMELMMEFIPGLYPKIADEKNKRQKSYLQILHHIRKINPKAPKQDQHAHYSEALKEAKKYIIADRKWIALKEIDKQCQEIENHESFHNKPKTWIQDEENPKSVTVASVLCAIDYCKNELCDLQSVRTRLVEYFDIGPVLRAEKGGMTMTREIKNNLVGNKEAADAQKIKNLVQEVARVNGITLPSS